MTQEISIDKIRAIVAWADQMDEHFNQQVRSVKDFEKLYDYAEKNQIEAHNRTRIE